MQRVARVGRAQSREGRPIASTPRRAASVDAPLEPSSHPAPALDSSRDVVDTLRTFAQAAAVRPEVVGRLDRVERLDDIDLSLAVSSASPLRSGSGPGDTGAIRSHRKSRSATRSHGLRRRAATWFTTAIAAACGLLAPGLAMGADGGQRDGWRPGASIHAAGRALPVDRATAESTERGVFENEGNRLFGMVGLGLELTSPQLVASPAAPRAFLRFGVSTFFDQEDRVVNEAAPGGIVVPIIDNNSDGIPDAETPVATIQGVGSATGAKTEVPSLNLALGLDWRVEVFDQGIHIKPSLEWVYERERITTILGFAESIDGDPDECPCRTGSASAETTQPFHGIGPGLEIEFDAGPLGIFQSSFFLRGQAFYQLDRKVNLSASGPLVDDADMVVGTVNVNADYERARWDYMFGAGLRLTFRPD